MTLPRIPGCSAQTYVYVPGREKRRWKLAPFPSRGDAICSPVAVCGAGSRLRHVTTFPAVVFRVAGLNANRDDEPRVKRMSVRVTAGLPRCVDGGKRGQAEN
jgi:hypothetical protein